MNLREIDIKICIWLDLFKACERVPKYWKDIICAYSRIYWNIEHIFDILNIIASISFVQLFGLLNASDLAVNSFGYL